MLPDQPALTLSASQTGSAPALADLSVQRSCGSNLAGVLKVSTDATWLHALANGGVVHVSADPAGLATGTYSGTVRVALGTQETRTPVQLRVSERSVRVFVPAAMR